MDNFSPTENVFEPIEKGDEDLCRALWISVIVQAFVDAGGKSPNAKNCRDRRRAREWLNAENEDCDFAHVCDLAGLPFRRTQKRLNELLASEHETLDFRCLTKSWGKSQTVESRARFFKRARRNSMNRHSAFMQMNGHSLM